MTRATSIAVYHQIKEEGLLSRRRLIVYETLFYAGEPQTYSEVLATMRRNGTVVSERSGGSSRMTELVTRKVVREREERACRITGRRVTTYEVVAGQLPVKPVRVKDGPRAFFVGLNAKGEPVAVSRQELMARGRIADVCFVREAKQTKAERKRLAAEAAARALTDRPLPGEGGDEPRPRTGQLPLL